MQRQCVNCGAALGPSDTFCGECGVQVAPVAYPPPTTPPVYYTPPPPLTQKRRGNTGLVIGIIVVLLAALGGGGFLLLRGGGFGGNPTATPTPNLNAAFTPTGVIATAAPGSTPTGLAANSKPFTRGEIRKLTNNTDPSISYNYPAWNINGTRLAFTINQSGSTDRHIYIVPASGGNPQQLTTDSGVNEYKPIWFGDSQIAFTRWITDSSGNAQYRSYYVSSSGGTPAPIISDTLNTNQYAMIDSNSSALVVAEDNNSNLHVYQIGAQGVLSNIRQLDTNYWFVASSSSDRYYVFPKAESDKSTNLYLMSSATSAETQLTNTPADEGQPSWRAGDRLIAFTYYDRQPRTYVVAFDDQGKPGQPFRLLSDNLGTYDTNPVWSPTTNEIAFISDREGGADNLYVMKFTPANDNAAWLGVTTLMLSDNEVKNRNLSFSKGAIVEAVADGSPANNAGIQQDDVIISVDGTKIDDFHPLAALLLTHLPGDSVQLEIYQKMAGTIKTMSVTTTAHLPAKASDR